MSEKKEVSKKGSSTKIVLNRQSDLILTGATIETPVGIVLEDIKGVEEAFKKEASTREKADAKLAAQSKLQALGLTLEEIAAIG